MNRRNLVTFFITIVVACALVVGIVAIKRFIDYQASLTPVTFRYNQVNGASVTLYKGARKDIVQSAISGEPIAISSGETRQLEDWPYVVVVEGTDIQKTTQIIYPHQTPQTINISVALTDSRLDTLLQQEKTGIEQIIIASNPKISSLYSIGNIKLHGDGSWATASLYYIGDDKWVRDTLHVVLRKKEGVWTLLTKPQITIPKSDLGTDVPDSVFRAIIPEDISTS